MVRSHELVKETSRPVGVPAQSEEKSWKEDLVHKYKQEYFQAHAGKREGSGKERKGLPFRKWEGSGKKMVYNAGLRIRLHVSVNM